MGTELIARPRARTRTATRVVVVEESGLIREALRVVLGRSGRFDLVGAAGDPAEGVRLVRTRRPALVIAQEGAGLCRALRATAPQAKIVVLASSADPADARAAIAAGASAYLLKRLRPDTLVSRIGDVLDGLIVLDELLGLEKRAAFPAEDDLAERRGLSPREREVLTAMSEGLDNRMIADRLRISQDTVKSHVKAVLRKLPARDRTHAVAINLGAAHVG